MRIQVYLCSWGQRIQTGVLDDSTGSILFEYDPSFLTAGIPFSPFMLPLRTGVFLDKDRTFEGLFGAFNDSLPDGWGRLLIDRKLQQSGISLGKISPLQRLAMVGSKGMGALEYEPADTGPDFSGESINLDRLKEASDSVLEGSNPILLDELAAANGSSGGARPKIVANVSKNRQSIINDSLGREGYDSWIIKFPTALDGNEAGIIEYRYSLLAKQAGIEMPDTYLFPSKSTAGYFGTKRFDREGIQKIHMHTACGLVHANHRFMSLDYENLIKLTAMLTKDSREVENMVRLMVFNVKTGNKDDHSKNFSFLLGKDNHWKLSPAYDLTPSKGIGNEQTAMVNGKATEITDSDLSTTADKAGNVSPSITKAIIQQVETSMESFPDLRKFFPR